ncbi:MAG TPA: helix-turn-helix domain-containing protein [Gemmataceae bacterium]|jgi:excisionase family DNA binding protein|nr:helix-turn-helix domain-containing protein [Gemmataceae bacterium]
MNTACHPQSPNDPITSESAYTLFQALLERLDRLEQNLALARPKETYTTDEAAERLNRSPWTVRDWCNKGQVPGAYRVKGKGRRGEWRIPHDVLVRVQNEGPGPVQKA